MDNNLRIQQVLSMMDSLKHLTHCDPQKYRIQDNIHCENPRNEPTSTNCYLLASNLKCLNQPFAALMYFYMRLTDFLELGNRFVLIVARYDLLFVGCSFLDFYMNK